MKHSIFLTYNIMLFQHLTFIKSAYYLNVSSSDSLYERSKIMGLYLKSDKMKNNHFVYKSLDNGGYIYYDNTWAIGENLYIKSLWADEHGNEPQEIGWKYLRNGFHQDASALVKNVTVPDHLKVISSEDDGPVARNHPDLLGVYSLQKSPYNGFPVYKAVGKDSFIFVGVSYSKKYWLIGKRWDPTLTHQDTNPTPIVPSVTGWNYKHGSGQLEVLKGLTVEKVNVIDKGWTLLEGFNCPGATDLKPNGFSNHLSLSECLSVCLTYSSCEGVIRYAYDKKGQGVCFMKKDIILQKCSNNTHWNLYKKDQDQGKCEGGAETCTLEDTTIGIIVGIVSAVICLIIICVVVILVYRKKKQDRKIDFVDNNHRYGGGREETSEMNEIVDTNE